MKRTGTIMGLLLVLGCGTMAQNSSSLTLEQCYDMLSKTSPLAKQKALTITAGNLAEKNYNLKWLPQAGLNGQATYQSDVTSFPAKLPNLTVDELSKDQYKAALEVVQPVYDGGMIAGQKKLQHIVTDIESQKVEVDLYQLRSKVNAYFFTALLMEDNISLMHVVEEDINNNIKKISAQAANGLATNSNAEVLKAELLKTEQKIIEYDANRKAAVEMLEILTGSPIAPNTSFVKPAASNTAADVLVTRPELKLYDFQKQQYRQQYKLVTARTNPKLSLFANGGYGKPGLNMLKNEFQWYYTGGIRLSIPITDLFTQQREKKLIRMQEQIVDIQKENFLTGNRQWVAQQRNEVEKYRKLVSTDAEIVQLRTRIRENAAVRLANGIITSSDYVTELNAENQAMLNQKLHEIQELQAQYNYKLALGK